MMTIRGLQNRSLLITMAGCLVCGCNPPGERAEGPGEEPSPCALPDVGAGVPEVRLTGERDFREAAVSSAAEGIALGGKEGHRYRIELDSRQAVLLRVEQLGADVALVLRDPSEVPMLVMDRPIGDSGFEELTLLAEVPTRLTLDIANPGKSGRYRFGDGSVRRPSSPADRFRSQAERSFMVGRRAEKEGGRQCQETALDAYSEALVAWRRASHDRGAAVAMARQAEIRFDLGDRSEARRLFRSALAPLKEAGELLRAAEVHNSLGVVAVRGGDLESAIDHYREADRLGAISGNEFARTQALGNLGMAHFYRGETEAAVEALEKERAQWRNLGRPAEEVAALNNLAEVYLEVGDGDRAVAFLRQSLDLAVRHGALRGEAGATARLGRALLQAGDSLAAERTLERAKRLYEGLEGAEHPIAGLLNDLGRLYRREGRLRAAQAAFSAAEEIYRRLEPPALRDAAVASMHRARIYEERSRPERALRLYGQVLEEFETLGDRDGRASTRYGEARALLALGKLPAALSAVERAIGRVEERRRQFADRRLGTRYLARKHDYFALKVEILMRMHGEDPRGGHDFQALLASEEGRARALLDLLFQGRHAVAPRVGQEWEERRKALLARIRGLEAVLESGPGSDFIDQEDSEGLHEQLLGALAELEGLEARFRREDPRYATLTRPDLLTLEDLQKDFLEEGTLLLVYALGEGRSWIWAIDPSEVRSFPLAGRKELEATARRVHKSLSSAPAGSGPGDLGRDLEVLGRSLLRPLSGRLSARRLVIVPDGALHYLPFSVLPVPMGPGAGEPLISRFHLSLLPSIASIREIRRQDRQQPPPDKVLAVIADPVYGPGDDRLGGSGRDGGGRSASRATTLLPADAALLRQGGRGGFSGFLRLAHAGEEAREILSLVAPEDRFAALGFEATLAALRRSDLRRYRWLHIVGHGVLDERHPRLSGLVLSQVDASGRRIPGILRLHEVYSLDLPVELVVLSACSTGLGEEIRGEGLVGLTRGFFYAGARRLVVSLWDVQDHATAELMKSFYRSMIEQSLSPSAALAAAQNEIRRRPGWQGAYFWAGFSLQGDWR